VWHILDDGEFELLLANAADVKNVPGRKTDVNDAMWLAELLAHGLIRASFMPNAQTQEMRNLLRTRKQLVRQQSSHVLRVQKTLEDANIKLDSALTDVMGESGRAMIEALIAGETIPAKLARRVHCVVGLDAAILPAGIWTEYRRSRAARRMFLAARRGDARGRRLPRRSLWRPQRDVVGAVGGLDLPLPPVLSASRLHRAHDPRPGSIPHRIVDIAVHIATLCARHCICLRHGLHIQICWHVARPDFLEEREGEAQLAAEQHVPQHDGPEQTASGLDDRD
jgi:Transposase